jgi:uncharacterized protein (DUF1015 family)
MAADQPAPDGASFPDPAGLVLAPLRGVRYATRDSADLARLTCPPYDVIDDAQKLTLETADPHNIVRLILPRGDGSDPDAPYRAAASTLQQWLATGVLAPDDAPALYVYEMRGGGSAVRGLIGDLHLVRADAGIVLPHEDTMPGPVRHRLKLIEAAQANLEPIFLVVAGPPGVAARAVLEAERHTPLVELRAPDGSEHRLWSITDPDTLAGIAADLLPRRALLADGHHRYEAYLQYQAARRGSGAASGPWDRGLAFLVDASAFGARVQTFHRVVTGLHWDVAVRRAGASFRLTALAGGERAALAELDAAGADDTAFAMTDGDRWLLLTEPASDLLSSIPPARHSELWRRLDVVVLHHALLTTVWGIEVNEATVRYLADPGAAVRAARSSGGIAVLLNPTPLDTVLAIAAAGERMPQKSTLFVPKPRTGMVLRTYAEEARAAGDAAPDGPAR